MQFAPIAVFVFNRPEHTAKMLASLEENVGITESPIFIFADGPRGPSDVEAVSRTRKLVSEWGAQFHCQLFFSDVNRGLAKSIVSGIDVVFEKYDRVIVIEDDLIFSSYFLSYINNSLTQYCNDAKIWQISGYMFPIQPQSRDLILLPLVSTWGWGTWKSKWKNFPRTRSQILNLSKRVRNWKSFDLDGAYPYRRRLDAQLRSIPGGSIGIWRCIQARHMRCFRRPHWLRTSVMTAVVLIVELKVSRLR